jgi:hypothetical protein
VWELHLAGGFYLDGYYLDAHCGSVPAALLEIATDVVPRLRNLRAIVFESVPESLITLGVSGMRRVLEDLHDLANLPMAGNETIVAPGPAAQEPLAGQSSTTAEREARLVAYTTRASNVRPDGDPGADILRYLTDHARLALVTGTEPERLRWMLTQLGKKQTDALLTDFLSSCQAFLWPDEEGSAFARWYDDNRSTWDSMLSGLNA